MTEYRSAEGRRLLHDGMKDKADHDVLTDERDDENVSDLQCQSIQSDGVGGVSKLPMGFSG